jgi:subtilisin
MKTLSLFAVAVLLVTTATTTIAQVIPGRYIAVFNDGVEHPAAAALELAQQHGANLSAIYEHSIKGFAFAGAPQAAAALSRRAEIAYVEQDQVFQAWSQTVPTGVARADAVGPQAQSTWGTALEAVQNVKIAIIDTGLDGHHADLNVAGDGVRFYTKGPWLYQDSNWHDDNGHGTHVGGTVAAKDNNVGVIGVAPGAPLTAVKVLDKNGSGSTTTVIAGVDWVAARAKTFAVANMSLGGGFSRAINDAVNAAVDGGVVFVVAAGNSSDDASKYSPASAASAITVSALADSDGKPYGEGEQTSRGADDYFATFSNYGAVIDICAPGVNILSTWPGGGYITASGTSMAAPHVAGAAALYIAANSGKLPADVADALKTAGWQADHEEYLLGGDKDSIPEPLLNVAALFGVNNKTQVGDGSNGGGNGSGGTDPPTQPTTVSVTSIAYSTSGGRTADKDLIITVSLQDDLTNPVSGASVSVTVKNTDRETQASGSGTTGSNGTVTFKWNNAPSGYYTTEVNSVTASGLTWDRGTPPNWFTK